MSGHVMPLRWPRVWSKGMRGDVGRGLAGAGAAVAVVGRGGGSGGGGGRGCGGPRAGGASAAEAAGPGAPHPGAPPGTCRPGFGCVFLPETRVRARVRKIQVQHVFCVCVWDVDGGCIAGLPCCRGSATCARLESKRSWRSWQSHSAPVIAESHSHRSDADQTGARRGWQARGRCYPRRRWRCRGWCWRAA